MRHKTAMFLAIFAALAVASAPSATAGDRWWFGGGVGLSLGGNVEYISVEPLVGYSATERLSLGLRGIYRHREDDRFSPSLSTNDYGGGVFSRYLVRRPFFVQAEYEYLRYEFLRFDGSTGRDDFSSVLAGGGFHQPLGGRASFFVVALYNFSYDDNEISPYDDRWVVRAGIGVNF